MLKNPQCHTPRVAAQAALKLAQLVPLRSKGRAQQFPSRGCWLMFLRGPDRLKEAVFTMDDLDQVTLKLRHNPQRPSRAPTCAGFLLGGKCTDLHTRASAEPLSWGCRLYYACLQDYKVFVPSFCARIYWSPPSHSSSVWKSAPKNNPQYLRPLAIFSDFCNSILLLAGKKRPQSPEIQNDHAPGAEFTFYEGFAMML